MDDVLLFHQKHVADVDVVGGDVDGEQLELLARGGLRGGRGSQRRAEGSVVRNEGYSEASLLSSHPQHHIISCVLLAPEERFFL